MERESYVVDDEWETNNVLGNGSIVAAAIQVSQGTHLSGTKNFITYNPESKPLPVDSNRLTHGLPKLDWVTVWFLGLKKYWITSPTLAAMLLGLNTRLPPGPTWIVWVAAGAVEVEVEVEGEEIEARERNQKTMTSPNKLKHTWVASRCICWSRSVHSTTSRSRDSDSLGKNLNLLGKGKRGERQ